MGENLTLTDARTGFAEFNQLAPGATDALRALSNTFADSGLAKAFTELIKIRASQINGCAFCVQSHLNAARKLSVVQTTKLDLIAVWRDADVFTAREMAALAWSEVVTCTTPAGVSDEAHNEARKEFSESELAFLTIAIAGIKAWNSDCDGVSLHAFDTTRRNA